MKTIVRTKNSLKTGQKFSKTYSAAAVPLWQQRSKSSTRQFISRCADPRFTLEKIFQIIAVQYNWENLVEEARQENLEEENKKIIYIFFSLVAIFGVELLGLASLGCSGVKFLKFEKNLVFFIWQEIWKNKNGESKHTPGRGPKEKGFGWPHQSNK